MYFTQYNPWQELVSSSTYIKKIIKKIKIRIIFITIENTYLY